LLLLHLLLLLLLHPLPLLLLHLLLLLLLHPLPLLLLLHLLLLLLLHPLPLLLLHLLLLLQLHPLPLLLLLHLLLLLLLHQLRPAAACHGLRHCPGHISKFPCLTPLTATMPSRHGASSRKLATHQPQLATAELKEGSKQAGRLLPSTFSQASCFACTAPRTNSNCTILWSCGSQSHSLTVSQGDELMRGVIHQHQLKKQIMLCTLRQCTNPATVPGWGWPTRCLSHMHPQG
jgi:hypothetical protein